jgi:hypothetical protein
MSTTIGPAATSIRPNPSELRKLRMQDLAAVLEAQAALAEQAYRADPELTAFEAFGEEEPDGDNGAAEAQ